MQNKSRSINLYGALGSALLVSFLVVGLVFLVASTTSVFRYSSDGTAGFLALSFVGLLLALFSILPLLLTSRYGWRTVLTTVLVQSVLIFSMLFVVTLVAGTQNSDKCYATASSAVKDVAIGPNICY